MDTWKQKALAEYEQREALRKAEEDRRYNKRNLSEQKGFAEDLSTLLGVTVESRDVGIEKTAQGELIGGLTLDGVDFTRARKSSDGFGYYTGIAVYQQCDRCEAKPRSRQLITLADLGAQLQAPESPYHNCRPGEQADEQVVETERLTPTTSERLLEALQDFITERAPQS